MVKTAVKVLIRARPTANFASKNIKLDPMAGVRTIKNNLDFRQLRLHMINGKMLVL